MRWLVLALLAACRAPFGTGAEALSPAEAQDRDPAPNRVLVELRAAPHGAGYAYNGQVPGPTIRAKRGDEVVVRLENALDAPTTIHWHGLHVPNAMDGVPSDANPPIAAGARFEYRFTVEQVGTFWYHPHFDTAGQVDRGLYGVLVVEDPTAPDPEEVVLVFDQDAEHPARPSAHGHARLDGRWRVNGAFAPALRLEAGRVVHARLLNASNAGYLDLRLPEPRQIASDQGWLSALARPSSLVLAPGDRAELELLVSEGFSILNAPYSLNGGPAVGEPAPLLTVTVDTPKPAPAGLPWPFTGARPAVDPGYADIVWSFAGSDRTGVWKINGQRFPDITMSHARRGEVKIIELRNLSPTEHPFHLHGHAFEVLSRNGAPSPLATIEDTVNLAIRDRLRLRLHATNPGAWMAHCHILPHAEDGMMTMIEVEP